MALDTAAVALSPLMPIEGGGASGEHRSIGNAFAAVARSLGARYGVIVYHVARNKDNISARMESQIGRAHV